jgi:hypothetical protein
VIIDPSGVDPRPHCGATSAVTVITGTPATVRAWSCEAGGTEWAITVVPPRPQSFLDRLTATVMLRRVIAWRSRHPGSWMISCVPGWLVWPGWHGRLPP